MLQVAFPTAVTGMVTEAVLVESFEPGRSVAHFAKKRTPVNTEIVALGVDTYLAMLLKWVLRWHFLLQMMHAAGFFMASFLRSGSSAFTTSIGFVCCLCARARADVCVVWCVMHGPCGLHMDTCLPADRRNGFVHTDLHPGNILVRMLDEQGSIVDDEASGIASMLGDSSSEALNHRPGQDQPQGSSGDHPQPQGTTGSRGRHKKQQQGPARHLRAQVVLLDFGLAEELEEGVKFHFISFLNCIGSGEALLCDVFLSCCISCTRVLMFPNAGACDGSRFMGTRGCAGELHRPTSCRVRPALYSHGCPCA